MELSKKRSQRRLFPLIIVTMNPSAELLEYSRDYPAYDPYSHSSKRTKTTREGFLGIQSLIAMIASSLHLTPKRGLCCCRLRLNGVGALAARTGRCSMNKLWRLNEPHPAVHIVALANWVGVSALTDFESKIC